MATQTTQTAYANWKFKENHVRGEHVYGSYASADATLICSGPPNLTGNTAALSDTVFPIGYLENFTLQQSKQLQRLYEVGSQRAYFIPGRVIGSVSLGRVYYHGHSLLRVLYGAYPVGDVPAGTTVNSGTEFTMEDDNANLVGTVLPSDAVPVVRVPAGANKFWLNLASDIFNQPHGLALYFQDASERFIGANYIESCYVQGHQLSVNAGSILLMEGATLQYDRMIPIQVTSTAVSQASVG